MYELPKDKNKILPNVFHEDCPARYLLSIVSDKWSLLIIDALGNRAMRNGELMKVIGGVSQKMLTQTLRKLETIKLINRHDMETVPPHVEYELSNLGLSLREKVCALDRWVEENMMEAMPKNMVNYV